MSVIQVIAETPSGVKLTYTVGKIISIDGIPYSSFQTSEVSTDKLNSRLTLLEAAFQTCNSRLDSYDKMFENAVVTNVVEEPQTKETQ